MYHGKVSNSFRIWFRTPFNLNVLLKSRLWLDEMFQKGRRGLAYASFDCLQEEAVASVPGLRELHACCVSNSLRGVTVVCGITGSTCTCCQSI